MLEQAGLLTLPGILDFNNLCKQLLGSPGLINGLLPRLQLLYRPPVTFAAKPASLLHHQNPGLGKRMAGDSGSLAAGWL